MRLTRGGEYGIRGMLHLAMQPPQAVTLLSEISAAQRIPESYLSKIFQALSKAGLVRSHRGFKGGYSLARDASEVNLREIIEGIEGPIALNRCAAEPSKCDEELHCRIQDVWKEAQRAMLAVLEGTSLADLARRTLAGRP